MNILLGLLVLSPFTTIIPLLFIIKEVKKKRIEIEFNYWTTGLLALFVWAFLVGVINKDFLSTLGSLMLFGYFFIAVGAIKIIKNKFTLINVIKKLVLFTTIAAIVGIAEKFIFGFMGYPTHRIYSTFGNPNMTGSWFASSIFMVIYLMNLKEERKYLKRYTFSIFTIIIAMLFTGSRGACVATIGAGIIIAYLTKVKLNKKTLIITGIVSVLILLVAFGEVGLISKYVTAHPLVDSISPRLKIWSGALDMFSQKPLMGWGLLATMTKGVQLVPLYNMNTIHAHNLWLSLLSSLGIVGLSIYLYMKIRLFKDMYTLFFINKNLALLFIAINSIVIIQGLIDVSLFAPQLGILFVTCGSITQKIAQRYPYTIKSTGTVHISNIEL